MGPGPVAALGYYARDHADVALLHTAAKQDVTISAVIPGVTILAMAPQHICEVSCGSANALAALQQALTAYRQVLADAPADWPIGWVVQFSYDLAYGFENIGKKAGDDLRWPLVRAVLYKRYAIYDHAGKSWVLLALAPENADEWAREFEAISGITYEHSPQSNSEPVVIASPSRPAYEAGVRRILEYIAAGDIYQANLTHRWGARTSENPWEIYGRLAEGNPAEFAAYMQWQNSAGRKFAVASASPELFLRRDGDVLSTRPMKGTRKRGADAVADLAEKNDLLHSEKDKAELAMIVDLLRNDLGRVSEFGSVKVTRPRTLEAHPAVWQTTATVESRVRGDLRDDWAALLAAIIPGGSITGAPKIRACQIIDELEPHRRGLYCGHIGMINPVTRACVLSIVIRTILMTREAQAAAWEATISAGAGIVADSDPSAEYEETCVKAAAMLRAIGR